MKFRKLYPVIIMSFLMAVYGCGNGGGDAAGLIGSLSLATSVTGPVITATATYSNASALDNLAGLGITFSTDPFGSIGTYHTDSLGKAVAAFKVPAFNGQKTILGIDGVQWLIPSFLHPASFIGCRNV